MLVMDKAATSKVRFAVPTAKLVNDQKVLIYTESVHDVYSIRGTHLGKKRKVYGTGYVQAVGTRLIVNSKKLGKIAIVPENQRDRYIHKSINGGYVAKRGVVLVEPIDE